MGAQHRFTSETAKKAAKKKGKHRKTQLWEDLGNFLVEEGAALFMDNVQRLMRSPDPKEAAIGMSMYKDTLEFFKPKLSRQELKGELDTTLRAINVKVIDGNRDTKEIQAPTDE